MWRSFPGFRGFPVWRDLLYAHTQPDRRTYIQPASRTMANQTEPQLAVRIHWIHGPAGSGKSTKLNELTDGLQHRTTKWLSDDVLKETTPPTLSNPELFKAVIVELNGVCHTSPKTELVKKLNLLVTRQLPVYVYHLDLRVHFMTSLEDVYVTSYEPADYFWECVPASLISYPCERPAATTVTQRGVCDVCLLECSSLVPVNNEMHCQNCNYSFYECFDSDDFEI